MVGYFSVTVPAERLATLYNGLSLISIQESFQLLLHSHCHQNVVEFILNYFKG